MPAGFAAPVTLRFEDIVATAHSRDHLSDDVAGINASLDLIARTRGGGWPTEPVAEEGNFIDLVWHECEFRDGYSFSYTVHTDKGEYLGCCYFYPMGKRTPLSGEMARYDVDASWWVRRQPMNAVITKSCSGCSSAGEPETFHSPSCMSPTSSSRPDRPK